MNRILSRLVQSSQLISRSSGLFRQETSSRLCKPSQVNAFSLYNRPSLLLPNRLAVLNTPISSYKTRTKFAEKREFKDENAEYKSWVPVETTGEALDFKVKEQCSFQDFDIPPSLLARLDQLGYSVPFEIQKETLKHTLSGRDLIGKAFTGSGKTLAFAIPIISRIINSQTQEIANPYPKCLVLSPTRELCLQLSKTIEQLAPELKSLAIYGGAGMEQQMRALRGRVDIVCATPGRLRDLMRRKHFRTEGIELICLDEADELLTPNFLEQIKDIIEISNKKQMLMFSATINRGVLDLVKLYMKNPVTVDLTTDREFKLPKNIEHYIHSEPVSRHAYAKVVSHYLEQYESERCIVFTNTKIEAKRIDRDLQQNGIRSTDFHSDLSQDRRQKLLSLFRMGKIKVLVATDVAARGIDIPEINLVLHVGPPSSVDAYIHRSGRTGRAGRVGRSVIIDDGQSINYLRFKDLRKILKFKKSHTVGLDLSSPSPSSDTHDSQRFTTDSESKWWERKPRFEEKKRDYVKSSKRFSNKWAVDSESDLDVNDYSAPTRRPIR